MCHFQACHFSARQCKYLLIQVIRSIPFECKNSIYLPYTNGCSCRNQQVYVQVDLFKWMLSLLLINIVQNQLFSKKIPGNWKSSTEWYTLYTIQNVKKTGIGANRTFMCQTHGLNLYNAALMHIDCIISYPIWFICRLLISV